MSDRLLALALGLVVNAMIAVVVGTGCFVAYYGLQQVCLAQLSGGFDIAVGAGIAASSWPLIENRQDLLGR